MRRPGIVALSLLLAAGIHVDWHLARPQHHRLSLGWSEHWLFAGALFAVIGWVIARRWPAERWQLGGWVLVSALLLAQLVEPLLEVAFYQHRLGYPHEPERWRVFWVCLATGLPAYAAALWLCAPPEPEHKPARVRERTRFG